MNVFKISDTDFEIDQGNSRFTITREISGQHLLTLDVKGSQVKFDAIESDEDSEWSWALYPPALYIHEFPVSEGIAQLGGRFSLPDRTEYEIGLYMMEHSELMGVEMEIVQPSRIHVKGRVNLFGKEKQFEIHYAPLD
jgi:hypothetical protein